MAIRNPSYTRFRLEENFRFGLQPSDFLIFQNRASMEMRKEKKGVKCGTMQEKASDLDTCGAAKVPKGRPARAPTSTADRRNERENEGRPSAARTKGAGAFGARTLCALIFLCSAIGCRGRSPCWTSLGHFAAPQCRGRRPFLHCPALHAFPPHLYRIPVLHFFLHENMVSEALVVIFGIYAKNAAQQWGREPLGCPRSLFPEGQSHRKSH